MKDALTGTPKENQPEYGWKIENEEDLLMITHINENGRKYSTSHKYKPHSRGYTTDITVGLMPEDRKLEIVPYHLQVLNNAVSIRQFNGTVDTLLAGLVDAKSVAFLALKWTGSDGVQRINQYFFENDKPAGCNLTFLQAPSWPTNRPAMITESIRPYFDALTEMVTPEAAESLTKCIQLLATAPGKSG